MCIRDRRSIIQYQKCVFSGVVTVQYQLISDVVSGITYDPIVDTDTENHVVSYMYQKRINVVSTQYHVFLRNSDTA